MVNDRNRVPAQLFRLSRPQLGWLTLLIAIAFAAAFYLRYQGIEKSQVALACQAGAATWFCAILKLVTDLFRHSVFGWAALAAALVHLIHPSLVLFAFALVGAIFGVILYNAALCGLAAALLMLSFARRVPETI